MDEQHKYHQQKSCWSSLQSVTSCKEYPSWTATITLQWSWVYSFPSLNYRCCTFSVLTLPFVDISTQSLTFPHIHEPLWNQERPDKHFKPKMKKSFLAFLLSFSRLSHLSNLLASAETIPTAEQEKMSVFFSLCTSFCHCLHFFQKLILPPLSNICNWLPLRIITTFGNLWIFKFDTHASLCW